jgi:putative holliday junction resolvase
MLRIAGLDFGIARIGLALSDLTQFLASPICALSAQKDLKVTAKLVLAELAKHGPLKAIVIGLPIHMDGKESPLSLQVRAFKACLQELTALPIILWDERLTTAQSERMLKEANLSRKQRARYIDAVSAATILQNYLDAHDTRSSL